MIPVITTKDRAQLKAHALELLKKNAYEGLVILVEELQDLDFKLPEKVDKGVLLSKATQQSKLALVRYLVENTGVDTNLGKQRPLYWAAIGGDLGLTKYLVEHGANIRSGDDLALRLAAKRGHLEIVKYLVAQGANIYAYNKDALKQASKYGYTEIVDYLQEVLNNDSSNNN